MTLARHCLIGTFAVVALAACGTEQPRAAGPSVSATTGVATVTTPMTVGALPAHADPQGWIGSFARCAGSGERPLLLISALRGGTERYIVCERPDGDRVLRVDSPNLRPTPFEARFFTFTGNTQQYVTDEGMKFDLSRDMVTVTDDPRAQRGRIVGYTVETYWSSF